MMREKTLAIRLRQLVKLNSTYHRALTQVIHNGDECNYIDDLAKTLTDPANHLHMSMRYLFLSYVLSDICKNDKSLYLTLAESHYACISL